jgi:hypothetical protein
MVGVFVRDQHGIEFRDVLADSGQTLCDFAAADAGIDQDAGTGGSQEGRVAGTAGGQDANLENGRGLLSAG